ncbi:Uncharacterized conserved protein [Phaffia rhodozyma]|uniref:Uncharacterized conserved protein n=1 Tax=Phaffia rhodozyma TaxID=264483 RepID=A0A0F7SL98_PHARH|nr:Uncharacterized conserved protein [Phaffia rhodozyma]
MSGFSLNTTGGVASRFVSQTELDQVKANKDEEWIQFADQSSWAIRIGQEPPPRPQEEEYDPRSLFEKLKHNKDVKREEWDEKMKMGNQFRGLDSEEINFLAAEKTKSEEEERARRQADEDVLAAFRSAQRRSPSPPSTLLSPPIPIPAPASASNTSTAKPSSSSAATSLSTNPSVRPTGLPPASKGKAKGKSKLPVGVIVKKKAKPAAPSSAPTASDAKAGDAQKVEEKSVEVESQVGKGGKRAVDEDHSALSDGPVEGEEDKKKARLV